MREVATAVDIEVDKLVRLEEHRQLSQISLVASENYSSPAIRRFEGSIFADKNAEGYPGKRCVSGCEHADQLETLAIERAKSAFSCEHANVQAMSATIANFAIMNSLFQRSDRLMAMQIRDGGHLSHGAPFHASGQNFRWCFYGVSETDEQLDYDEVRSIALKYRPAAIICGGSSYPRLIDYEKMDQIAREVDALLWVDLAHTAGLVAGRAIPSPFPHADIVTTSTHKTLRGPRGGGLILCKNGLAQQIDRAIFPGLQGAPKMDLIAARAVLLAEVQTSRFKEYAKAVLSNAKALERGLTYAGATLVSGGTSSHLLLLNLLRCGTTGNEVETSLREAQVVANKNPIPFDTLPPSKAGGLRIGSAALTTRGFDEGQFFELGVMIGKIVTSASNPNRVADLRLFVQQNTRGLPLFNRKWVASGPEATE
ncbi:serine hydroxymethyltransferase [Ensifer sp. LCM 4579]|uniref:serine hydroxymethyltransferase n=1 Tax=Ensifer sp. LCM 4579 TaxID=1848292 RepID=UPI0008D9F5BD|nr:serine hydroxymethyltransferase [Ensifer sp. LCM 4579]OHV76723.1 serine hydroxymethyltransferase [Ensifer sp. LCM 4579]